MKSSIKSKENGNDIRKIKPIERMSQKNGVWK